MSLKWRSVSQMNIKTPRVPPRHSERPGYPKMADRRPLPMMKVFTIPLLAQQIQNSPSYLLRNSGVGHEVGALEDRILENPVQRVDRVARSGQVGQPTRRHRALGRGDGRLRWWSTLSRFTAHPAPRRADPARSWKEAGGTDEGRGPGGSGRPGEPFPARARRRSSACASSSAACVGGPSSATTRPRRVMATRSPCSTIRR